MSDSNKQTPNPPAYPNNIDNERYIGKDLVKPSQGMSLRDYFAAHIASGLASNPDYMLKPNMEETYPKGKQIAIRAYKVADKMLEQRMYEQEEK